VVKSLPVMISRQWRTHLQVVLKYPRYYRLSWSQIRIRWRRFCGL